MKSYLIKNKKYTFMILFFICCFFLFIDKSYAYVYKKEIWNAMNIYESSGFINNGNTTTITFNIQGNQIVPANVDYEYLVWRFNSLKFQQNVNINGTSSSTDYHIICTKWVQSGTTYTCTQTSINGNTTTDITNYSGVSLQNGIIYMQATLYYGNDTNNKSLCFMSSELQDMILCPMLKEQTQPITQFEIKITNGGYAGFYYALNLSGLKYGFNSDSKEIINALSNLGIIQQNTTTTIQNFNNYVSNNSTTQAQSSSTTALGGLSTTFNSHLSSMNELTQLVFLPVNFIITVASNQCQPLVWNIPFVNTQVVVPCMSTIYNGYFSAFIAVFSTIAIGLLTYRCLLKFFNTMKGILDAEDDKIEVIDL